jgi:hypothetical protein
MPASPKTAVSFHEAGHAVAFVRRSMYFEYVTINSSGSEDGHLAHCIDDHDEFPSDKLAVASTLLAGPLAESRRLGRRIDQVYAHGGGSQDAIDVANLELSDQEFKTAAEWALKLVEYNWQEICRVARALRRNERLTFDQVEALVFVSIPR